jgi:myo-inositol-1(or 4)-monophosphatase
LNQYLQVAIETAREAGAILIEELSRPAEISYKGDVDLVTQADQRSEAVVVSRLRCEFPEHSIVAEEGSGRESASRFRWYVDPLDGTTNFAHKFPWFAVSIGLAEGDDLVCGVVYNPANDELFTAARGEGAQLNGIPILVSTVAQMSAGLLGTGFPSHKRILNPNIHYYWQFTLASHGVRRVGAASLDLCSVACGRLDGFWEFGLKPWDTAAGTLIVREAGGMVTDWAGTPYKISFPECVASNGLIHAQMRALAAEISAGAPSLAPLPSRSL